MCASEHNLDDAIGPWRREDGREISARCGVCVSVSFGRPPYDRAQAISICINTCTYECLICELVPETVFGLDGLLIICKVIICQHHILNGRTARHGTVRVTIVSCTFNAFKLNVCASVRMCVRRPTVGPGRHRRRRRLRHSTAWHLLKTHTHTHTTQHIAAKTFSLFPMAGRRVRAPAQRDVVIGAENTATLFDLLNSCRCRHKVYTHAVTIWDSHHFFFACVRPECASARNDTIIAPGISFCSTNTGLAEVMLSRAKRDLWRCSGDGPFCIGQINTRDDDDDDAAAANAYANNACARNATSTAATANTFCKSYLGTNKQSEIIIVVVMPKSTFNAHTHTETSPTRASSAPNRRTRTAISYLSRALLLSL